MKLKVCELFAGVGGFRIGLENTGAYEIVWSNQWEPSTKKQHASIVYEAKFGSKNHSNKNIEEVPSKDIPDHDVLVGGFPCQDYSVATTLKNSGGLLGKKGVLWWSIHRILSDKKNKPKYLILENVDRLLKSPSVQRGRDFAVMLKSLSDLEYTVEWRVINAAEYGMPQRRRRIFIFGVHKSSKLHAKYTNFNAKDILFKKGLFAQGFPIQQNSSSINKFDLKDDIIEISKNFNKGEKLSPFLNSGVLIKDKISTIKSFPDYNSSFSTLAQILQNTLVSEDFYISEKDFPKWEYLKGGKKETRTTKDGFKYNYSEGSMVFPDALNNASRTIITGEGGSSPSRFKHVIKTNKGLRRLTPIELERLNMFPENHTKLEGITDTKRAFFMGNALVVGIVEQIANTLIKKIKS